MQRLLLLLFFLFFISCQKSEFENLLIDHSKKWLYIESGKFDKKAKAIYYLKFNSNGKSETYYVSNDMEVAAFEIESDCHWKYSEKDSILEVCGIKNKVLKFQKDTIRLFQKKDKYILFVNIKN